MKVYITTSGCYSDYSITNVFKNEEDAKAYVEGDYNADYVEYDVLETLPERGMWTTLTWWAEQPDREPARGVCANPFIAAHESEKIPSRKLEHNWVEQGGWNMSHRQPVLQVTGWSEQDVLKVYSEQRAIFLARKEGIS